MKETKLNKPQIPINFSFIADKSFDNFIIGKNNLVIEIIKNLIKTDHHSLVLIRGEKSSGKTHLCEALKKYKNNKVYLLNTLNSGKGEFLNLSYYDILIIDDIELIIKDKLAEENIFILINEFILMKKNILVTTKISIDKIKFSIPDLHSRLKSDQILDIYELSDNDKIRVLQKNAKERGWVLSEKVSDYIISHYKRDLYFLCNCIKYIDIASLSLKNNITIPFIKKIMEHK